MLQFVFRISTKIEHYRGLKIIKSRKSRNARYLKIKSKNNLITVYKRNVRYLQAICLARSHVGLQNTQTCVACHPLAYFNGGGRLHQVFGSRTFSNLPKFWHFRMHGDKLNLMQNSELDRVDTYYNSIQLIDFPLWNDPISLLQQYYDILGFKMLRLVFRIST